MSKELEALKTCPVFSGVDSAALAKLAGRSILRRCRAGETLFHTAQRADGFLIIVSGEIEVFRAVAGGREQVLHVLGPGEVCGSVPVFQGGSYPASARARVVSSVLYVPGAVFLELAFADPQVLLDMLTVMSQRLRQFAEQVESLSLHDVPARLLDYLRRLADDQGRVTLDCTKTELAARLGTVPETLSRALRKLSRTGEIETQDDFLFIHRF